MRRADHEAEKKRKIMLLERQMEAIQGNHNQEPASEEKNDREDLYQDEIKREEQNAEEPSQPSSSSSSSSSEDSDFSDSSEEEEDEHSSQPPRQDSMQVRRRQRTRQRLNPQSYKDVKNHRVVVRGQSTETQSQNLRKRNFNEVDTPYLVKESYTARLRPKPKKKLKTETICTPSQGESRFMTPHEDKQASETHSQSISSIGLHGLRGLRKVNFSARIESFGNESESP